MRSWTRATSGLAGTVTTAKEPLSQRPAKANRPPSLRRYRRGERSAPRRGHSYQPSAGIKRRRHL